MGCFKFVFFLTLTIYINSANIPDPALDLRCIQALKNIDTKIDTKQIPTKCKVARAIATWINLKNNYLSFEEGTDFLIQHPDWPIWNKLIVNLEDKITLHTPKSSLLRWFSKNPPRTIHGLESFLFKLTARERQAMNVRNLITNFWVSFNFTLAEQKTFYTKHRMLLTPKCHQQRLERLLWEENVTLANALIPLILKSKQPTYKYWMDVLRGKAVPSIYTTHPGIACALSQHLRKNENYVRAYKILLAAQPKRTFRLPRKFLHECAIVVRELVLIKEYNKALKLAETGISISPPQEEYYREFHWLSGWLSTAYLNIPSKGLYYFKKAFELTPSSFEKAQYAFWAGYSADRGRNMMEKTKWYTLAAHYPQTYYGQLANDVLKQPLILPALKNNSRKMNAFINRPLVMASLIMNNLGHHKIKSIFLDHLAHTLKTVEEHQLGLAITKATSIPYFAFHYYEEANKLVNLNVKDNWLKVEFESKKLPNPHLIQAIVYNESRFHPKIKDSLGAIGFMQIMPTTLAHITTTNGLIACSHKDLGNQPLRSLQIGETYLSELAEKFNNSPILITAAYNGGPSRLKKWLEKIPLPRNDYDFLWLEAFPVYDTRKYVKRVITTMRLYDELGSDVPVRTIAQFVNDFNSY